MTPMALTADELLAGGTLTHRVPVPATVLAPSEAARGQASHDPMRGGTVVLRPLVLADIHRIQKAARDTQQLSAVLMVQQALVEPSVTVEQVTRMHAGLVEFLLAEVNRVSGLSMSGDDVEETVHAPLARACFVLARQFGWTPEECSALTVGQVLLYLEMLARGEGGGG